MGVILAELVENLPTGQRFLWQILSMISGFTHTRDDNDNDNDNEEWVHELASRHVFEPILELKDSIFPFSTSKWICYPSVASDVQERDN